MHRLAGIIAILMLTACSAEQMYAAGQGWQRNQCEHLPDKAGRDQCMEKANTSYGQYQREKQGN
jgi:hypothetical protein